MNPRGSASLGSPGDDAGDDARQKLAQQGCGQMIQTKMRGTAKEPTRDLKENEEEMAEAEAPP